VGTLLLAATFDPGVAAIDLESNTMAGFVPCGIRPEFLLYNPANRTAYGINSTGREICVVGPDLRAGAPIPLEQAVSRPLLLDNGHGGLLLLTSSGQDGFRTVALDLRTLQRAPVPSLDGVYPGFIRSGVLYGGTAGSGALRLGRYDLTFGSGGLPDFRAESNSATVNGIPSTVDERFLYIGVPGYCSTAEGPVICSVGFRVLDAVTFEQRSAVILAQSLTFGSGPTLFGPRAIAVGVAGSYVTGGRAPVLRHP
jgi:hypothetical protein